MESFLKLQKWARFKLFGLFALLGFVVIASWTILQIRTTNNVIIVSSLSVIVIVLSVLCSAIATRYFIDPLRFVWQAILHVAPDSSEVPAPNNDQLTFGREQLTALVHKVYKLASQENGTDLAQHRKDILQATNIVSNMPLPLFVFNKDMQVTNASNSALEYCELNSAELFGKPLFESLNLEFGSENTLESWIKACQQDRVTATHVWERVRVILNNNKPPKQCDVVAYYNRDNPSGAEFIVTIFDRTRQYDQDDQSLSFVALAVHELRTPLTMLRGYIEVFEDELGPKMDTEMQDFMHKMRISAQQLTSFINNILNVARVEENQLTLKLTEEKWDDVLKQACEDVGVRAQVHGKTVKIEIAPDLPTVAVDRMSIFEVVNNLLDNALKYSGQSKEIVVRSGLNKQGMIQTTVEDRGAGIPASVLPNLFEKFYRNHRTRAQIGGTGLGLYLSKAITTAHGGQIWAESKEGEGSTFGFTLLPYANLAEELKTGNKDITRSAHGWIKNHSLYRR